jgi:hypothetical protein
MQEIGFIAGTPQFVLFTVFLLHELKVPGAFGGVIRLLRSHSSSLIAHVLHYPPPPHAHSFVLGTAGVNNQSLVTVESRSKTLGTCLEAGGRCTTPTHSLTLQAFHSCTFVGLFVAPRDTLTSSPRLSSLCGRKGGCNGINYQNHKERKRCKE